MAEVKPAMELGKVVWKRSYVEGGQGLGFLLSSLLILGASWA